MTRIVEAVCSTVSIPSFFLLLYCENVKKKKTSLNSEAFSSIVSIFLKSSEEKKIISGISTGFLSFFGIHSIFS